MADGRPGQHALLDTTRCSNTYQRGFAVATAWRQAGIAVAHLGRHQQRLGINTLEESEGGLPQME